MRRDGRLGIAVVAVHGGELGAVALYGREGGEMTLGSIVGLLS